MRTYKGIIDELPENGVFVFGSNTQGRHGKGAALVAKEKFGAIYGVAFGYQGRSYAIVTKDLTKKKHPSVPEESIRAQILRLYRFAETHTTMDFYVVYGVGNYLNGYTPEEMAELFSWHSIPLNIIFEDNFNKLVNRHG